MTAMLLLLTVGDWKVQRLGGGGECATSSDMKFILSFCSKYVKGDGYRDLSIDEHDYMSLHLM
jgi:hypothetical protein